MSGEAGGALFGGVLILALAPYIFAAIAVIGAAAGAVAITASLASKAAEYVEEKNRKKELEINRCSKELEDTYLMLRNAIESEKTDYLKCVENIKSRIEEEGYKIEMQIKTDEIDIRKWGEENIPTEEIDNRLKEYHTELNQALLHDVDDIRNEVTKKTNAQIQRCLDVIDHGTRTKKEMVDWNDKRATSETLQNALAWEQIRDAEASIRVIKNIAQNTDDMEFCELVRRTEQSCVQARTLFDNGLYESAFTTARKVVRESAKLATEQVHKEMEMDIRFLNIRAFLEGLMEEMEKQRYVVFEEDGQEKKYDLGHFSQGKYLSTIDDLKKTIEEAETCAKENKVLGMAHVIDYSKNTLEPEVRYVIRRSKEIFLGYYERERALNIVADFMIGQDYEMSWAAPMGGDASQELVVNFHQRATGNTVSVSLANQLESDDISNMALKLLSFDENNQEVSEERRHNLRECLMQALADAGIVGELECTGYREQSSPQIGMTQEKAVLNMDVETVI